MALVNQNFGTVRLRAHLSFLQEGVSYAARPQHVVQLFSLRPAADSILEQWQVTWQGVRRPLPLMQVRCVSSLDPSETIVHFRTGFARSGSDEHTAWESQADDLLKALQLEGAAPLPE